MAVVEVERVLLLLLLAVLAAVDLEILLELQLAQQELLVRVTLVVTDLTVLDTAVEVVVEQGQ